MPYRKSRDGFCCLNQVAFRFPFRVLADKMFRNCVEMIQTVSSHFKYVSPRFITILQFKFSHRSVDIISDMNFTFCFILFQLVQK